jgi:hypothetical protein
MSLYILFTFGDFLFYLFQINFFYDESEELGNITVAKCILNGKLMEIIPFSTW